MRNRGWRVVVPAPSTSGRSGTISHRLKGAPNYLATIYQSCKRGRRYKSARVCQQWFWPAAPVIQILIRVSMPDWEIVRYAPGVLEPVGRSFLSSSLRNFAVDGYLLRKTVASPVQSLRVAIRGGFLSFRGRQRFTLFSHGAGRLAGERLDKEMVKLSLNGHRSWVSSVYRSAGLNQSTSRSPSSPARPI
jgi:hypothetical protein